ncbi:MAG: site-specific integrase [Williamsia sp.]|nr:site-specific integrase [Williamsia sp.]
MASVKIILRKEEKADGTSPLAIRITKDRKTSYIYLNYSIHPKYWDENLHQVKRTYPNHVRLNNYLLKKLSEATDWALEVESKKDQSSAKTVRNKIKPSTGATFFPQSQSYLDNLKKSGKYNQYTADKPRIGHFKDFLKNEDISFADLSIGLLERFVVYLKSGYKSTKGKKPISARTVANHLAVLRSVFAHASKNEVVTKEQSPFGKGGIKIKFPDSNKVGLSPEDLESLENVELPDPYHHHCRNLWLISFYFAGMRVSDALRLKWSDFQNDRLHYSMGKNDKGGSLKVPEKALLILQQYEHLRKHKDDLIFPELKGVDLHDDFITQRTIAFKTSAIDKCLRLHVAPAAGINKKLTMHIARHTFGSLAGDAIPIQMLQKLYRHSHVSTTIGYQQNFIHKDADEALDAVINKSRIQPKPGA